MTTHATKTAHIRLGRMSMVPENVIAEFRDAVADDRLQVEVRIQDSVFAGIEWLMPTAIVLFITRAYFDAIFGELGKDHYKRLKQAASSLYRRVNALRIMRTGSSGKVAPVQTYSAAFSIVIITGEPLMLKFLIQPDLSDVDMATALSAFFDLVESLFLGSVAADVIARLDAGQAVGKTLLLAYDFDQEAIVTLDPLPPQARP